MRQNYVILYLTTSNNFRSIKMELELEISRTAMIKKIITCFKLEINTYV